jgi:aromatic ring-cleaving dioxygenase
MSIITSYHAHIYFDASSRQKARQLSEEVSHAFRLSVGPLHDKPVGPHLRGSCRLAFNADQFAQVIPWLIVNRRGLTIFAHAMTGDTLKDHTDHVLWLGDSEPIAVSALPTPLPILASTWSDPLSRSDRSRQARRVVSQLD